MQVASILLPLRAQEGAQGWHLFKWLVNPGARVYRKQRVAILKSSVTGAIDHATAPRSGTLFKSTLREGDKVDSSNPSIAQIQFCPHSIVYKGVCGMCGEEAEASHFAEAPSVSQNRLPVAYNSASLSVTRAEAQSVSSVTAKRLYEATRLSLVLDLDHTLVHATDDARGASILYHSPSYADKSSVAKLSLTPSPNTSHTATMHLKLRPNLAQFLNRVAAKFELHIYTMGSRPYADQVANLIDPDKRLFRGRITSREDFAEGRFNQKSIQRLFPCNDSMVLIVDDREDVWITSTGQSFMPNLIRARPYSFWDGMHEAYDRASVTSDSQIPQPDTPKPPLQQVKHSNQPLRINASPPKFISNGCHSKQVMNDRKPENGEKEKVPSNSGTTSSKTEEAPTLSAKCTKESVLNDSVLEGTENAKTPDLALEVSKDGTNGSSGDMKNSKSNGVSICLIPPEKGSAVLPSEPANTSHSESEPAPVFSSKLRKIVQGWWDADAEPKASNHLLRLAEVLELCHSRFFSVAKEKTGSKWEQGADKEFRAPADVKNILASIRNDILQGCVVTFTGVIPTNVDPRTVPAWNLAGRLGAQCSMEFINGRTTHVIASQHREVITQKSKEALESDSAFVITTNWLDDSALCFERQMELPYCLRLDDRFRTPAEHRQHIERNHKKAAQELRKRSLPVDGSNDSEQGDKKRLKADEPFHSSSNGTDTYSPCKANDSRFFPVDDIQAAMDAAFEDSE